MIHLLVHIFKNTEGDHSETVYETKESRARRKQYNQRQSNQFQHQESMNDSGPGRAILINFYIL